MLGVENLGQKLSFGAGDRGASLADDLQTSTEFRFLSLQKPSYAPCLNTITCTDTHAPTAICALVDGNRVINQVVKSRLPLHIEAYNVGTLCSEGRGSLLYVIFPPWMFVYAVSPRYTYEILALSSAYELIYAHHSVPFW